MAAPTVKYYKYIAETASFATLGSGSVCTLNSVTVNNWSNGVALRIGFERATSFDLDNVKVWWNDYNATVNDANEALDNWTATYVYTATAGLSSVQSAGVTCPAIALTTGDQVGFAKIAASKDADALADGFDLGLSAGLLSGETSYWSKFIGVSFKPNTSAQDGTYTNFSVQVGFEFS